MVLTLAVFKRRVTRRRLYSLDHEKIQDYGQEVEWSGGDLSEIHACIKEELESVLKDEHGTSPGWPRWRPPPSCPTDCRTSRHSVISISIRV